MANESLPNALSRPIMPRLGLELLTSPTTNQYLPSSSDISRTYSIYRRSIASEQHGQLDYGIACYGTRRISTAPNRCNPNYLSPPQLPWVYAEAHELRSQRGHFIGEAHSISALYRSDELVFSIRLAFLKIQLLRDIKAYVKHTDTYLLSICI